MGCGTFWAIFKKTYLVTLDEICLVSPFFAYKLEYST
jgi:hypothetical protein